VEGKKRNPNFFQIHVKSSRIIVGWDLGSP
jgi:hypothetical protein